MASLGDFIRLPAEIRNQIYLQLLVPAKRDQYYEGIKMFDRSPRQVNWKSPIPSATLLRASKAINTETASILYGCNRFKFGDPAALQTFLEAIGPSNTSLVADVEFCRGSPHFKLEPFNSALQTAPSLRRLHVHYHLTSCIPIWRAPHVLEFLMALRPILAAHPTLSKVMSRFAGGHLKNYPTLSTPNIHRMHTHSGGAARKPDWEAIHLTLVARDYDDPADGFVLDLDDEIFWLQRRLSMYPDEAAAMKRALDIEPLPLKPVTRFLATFLYEAV